ncbi:hypothetical protein [Providencia alcalifaciens]|jgi:hypothetical protein|uniref:hypothetical protein n=1 Tax=Providencia alcalifaciens TaxID=126385 RepID=UPI001CC492A5|nr:hypothetical protein NVI2019_KOLGMIGM_04206 [Providencia alcalifaciens]CAG9437405.1 hypothetical protein NVI2019_ANGEOOBF_04205 [Providencia alcalifaciens]CAG9437438.1 hypothetical protein NVI2019_OGMBKCAO_04206 [Providencia alcalifaciens]CAG9437447.1 hypothetical protein NVI2019_PLFLNFOB_04205 [Providencia alcalifaciens]CAG9437714.1 hypothetical protein NVI2019_OHEONHNH_04204 [Providencia alcalifaciens]
MKNSKTHITLAVPDDLNAWINFKSKDQSRSKRNFLLHLIEEARTKDLSKRQSLNLDKEIL